MTAQDDGEARAAAAETRPSAAETPPAAADAPQAEPTGPIATLHGRPVAAPRGPRRRAPRVQRLLEQLTDAEKVALTTGADAWSTAAIPRLGIPAIRLGDGPHGIRRPRDDGQLSMFDSHPATCFPTAVTLGSTWDARLVRDVGEALGEEARDHGVAVLLGPGVNLKRTPVGGRNFEYFSEDPLVSGMLGAAWTEGVQSTGVGVSVKHFAANNTERRRYGIDAIVDERALRELYLASFEPIVRGSRPATVMAAYNRLNGEHCTENAELLTRILRDEWGYAGVVVSDWGATWDRAVSIPAGADLAMPGLGRRDDALVLEAVRSGELSREDLDEAAGRILGLILSRSGLSDPDPDPDGDAGSEPAPPASSAVDLASHHALARRAAAAGTVLLQNDGVLPLRPGARVALIGGMAEEPRYQGAGSSHVVPTRLDTLRDWLEASVGKPLAENGLAGLTFTPGYDRHAQRPSRRRIAAAVAAARAADVAVVVVGLPETFETEGVDRRHLGLPHGHEVLIDAVARANPSTVVVLQNGSPVETPWRHEVSAIVEAYLGGQAGGSALADVLLGRADPGGRLAETFPERYDDHPVARLPNGPTTAEYRESLYVGYRWFDSADAPVAFPFGHGLSYTSFAWEDVTVTPSGGGDGDGAESGAGAESGDGGLTVEVTVRNVGERAGSDVVQVYVHREGSSVFHPEQELRGFGKVELEPGESERVRITLDARAFQHWDVDAHDWRGDGGRAEVRVARSSRDVVAREWIEVPAAPADTALVPVPVPALAPSPRSAPRAYREPSQDRRFPAADFEELLGHPLPPNRAPLPGEYTIDTAILDMQGSRIGRALLALLIGQATRAFDIPREPGAVGVAREVASQLTLRLLSAGSGARISRRLALRVLAAVNLLSRPRRIRTRARRR